MGSIPIPSAMINQSSEIPQRIESFETERGSLYTYLPDGQTQRYVAARNEQRPPTDAIVFMPPIETLRELTPESHKGFLDESEELFKQRIAEYMRGAGESLPAIIDENGHKLRTNPEIKSARKVFIALCRNQQEVDFYIPVAKEPRVGFTPIETRKTVKGGEVTRSWHQGHKITKINYTAK